MNIATAAPPDKDDEITASVLTLDEADLRRVTSKLSAAIRALTDAEEHIYRNELFQTAPSMDALRRWREMLGGALLDLEDVLDTIDEAEIND